MVEEKDSKFEKIAWTIMSVGIFFTIMSIVIFLWGFIEFIRWVTSK